MTVLPAFSLPRATEPLALYVHWPFCKAKCPYCDFNSHVREGVDQAAWRAALLQELRWVAGHVTPRPLQSVFFGGGTPSLMPPETVGALLAEAERLFGFAPAIEITLEANPTSSEAALFAAFRAAGVNRVSIGVQSLRDASLQALGRQHSVAEAKATIAMAAKLFPRFSFDLIYARPQQTLADWQAELEEALALAGDHLSLYQLTIEPHTQFETLYRSGRLVLPPDEVSLAMYEYTQERMAAHGMPAYEVSNHAREGQESRHNLVYWRYGAYMGIGPGAHGRLDGGAGAARIATRTHRAPELWLQRVTQEGHGYDPFEPLTESHMVEEAFMMGLRLTEGIDIGALSARLGIDVGRFVAWRTVARYVEAGLLGVTTDTQGTPARLWATPQGRLVLTRLTGELLLGG